MECSVTPPLSGSSPQSPWSGRSALWSHLWLFRHCRSCFVRMKNNLRFLTSFGQYKLIKTHSSMAIFEGISDQRRAYLTGVTCSWGSRSTCMCNIRRQKEALKSKGKSSSDMQRRIKSTSSWLEILLMARYWRSRHIRAKRFSWHLEENIFVCRHAIFFIPFLCV